jgi:hypothetical protein
MCGACGILSGGRDWVDRVGSPTGSGGDGDLTRIAERQRRIALANMLLRDSGIRIVDANGSLMLRSPTGRHEIVDSLMHVWSAADRLTDMRIDVLDLNFMHAIGDARTDE